MYVLFSAINCSKFLLHIKRNAHTEHIPESPASVTEAENVPVNIDNNIILTMLHQMKDNQVFISPGLHLDDYFYICLL